MTICGRSIDAGRGDANLPKKRSDKCGYVSIIFFTWWHRNIVVHTPYYVPRIPRWLVPCWGKQLTGSGPTEPCPECEHEMKYYSFVFWMGDRSSSLEAVTLTRCLSICYMRWVHHADEIWPRCWKTVMLTLTCWLVENQNTVLCKCVGKIFSSSPFSSLFGQEHLPFLFVTCEKLCPVLHAKSRSAKSLEANKSK